MLALILLAVAGYAVTAGCATELFFRGLWDGTAYGKADVQAFAVMCAALWPISGPLTLVYLLGRQARRVTGRVLTGREAARALPAAKAVKGA